MECVRWTERIRNRDVLERVGEERMMLKLVRKKRRYWLGHWLRRNCLLKNALEEMVNGRRVLGRRRYHMIDDIKIYRSYEETKRKAENRKDWRKLGLQESNAFLAFHVWHVTGRHTLSPEYIQLQTQLKLNGYGMERKQTESVACNEELWNVDAVKEELKSAVKEEYDFLTEESVIDVKDHKIPIDCGVAAHHAELDNDDTADDCGLSDNTSDQKLEFCGNDAAASKDLKQGIDTDLGVNSFKCYVCEKNFSRWSKLQKHLRNHGRDKPYKCTICGECYHFPYRLRAHLSSHTGERPFKCNVCEKSFTRLDHMRKHALTHSGEKHFKCSVCGKSFARLDHQQKHELTHKSDKPFKCDICGMTFALIQYLRQHATTHTRDKRLKCNFCDKTFARPQYLRSHLVTHVGGKQYECNICEKSFARSDYLRKHLLTHKNEKHFKCNFCDKKFAQNRLLRLHIETHTNEKRYRFLMDAVKDEPNLDPMALENDRNEEGERPMPMEGNFLKVDIEIKEEPSELVDDLTLDIKYEENISPTTIPLMKFETEIGLEVNPEKTKYVIMSRDENIVRNGNIKIGNLSFEEVGKFKYLGATLTNINDTREEIKHRINMGNACYYSVEKLLSSSLLSKNFRVRIYKTVILLVVLYGCETWTPTLREELRLRVFENKVLRKIFGAKRDEVTGEWRKLHNTELHALYSSPDIIRNMKSRRLRWAGHVAYMGESRNAYRVLVGRPEEKDL
ncbi:hypothetical protein ANN_00209 [Periplaneta americana]|uniref:C2H2-type domain-containing protein n=1 Tax=Periplaneta americana TaxID=6978 RepID=A0ABQ8TSH9_PERAM|nr:hypothetical protein ANN_00209 [Periplaneta americana]